MAQGGTPAATPIGPGTCMAPATAATAEATPVTGAALATPVTEERTGTPVEDQAVIDEATAAIANINACHDEGNGEAFVALFTEQGRTAAFGDVDPVELANEIQAMSTMAQTSNFVVHEVLDYGDGSLGVDYQLNIGKQVVHFTDTLVQEGDFWLVDGRTIETPETDLDSTTASVKTSISDGSVVIEVSPNPIMNQPAVKLQMVNNADSAEHVTLLQGGDAASMTDLDLANLPEGVTFVGHADAEPGAFVDTLFEGLEEGNYVVVVETSNGETGAFDITIDPPFDPNA